MAKRTLLTEIYNSVPTIPYEGDDEPIHTDKHLFCADISCPCHNIIDDRYYELICVPMKAGQMTPEEANCLYFGEDEPTGTHPPDCRCSWCEPQERNATLQCADGSWW